MTTAAKLTVVQALAAVMEDVREVRKTDRNTVQNFSFRGIDAVMNAVGPALRAHGVVILPSVTSIERSVVEVGQKHTPMGHVTVEVTYTAYGPAGDSLTGSVPGEAMDSGDKATPKAMSVAFRTFLLQALCLPTDDTDPDEHAYERSAPSKSKPKPAPDPDLVEQWTEAVDVLCGNADATKEQLRTLYAEVAAALGESAQPLLERITQRATEVAA
jgi:hypothetical protein